MAVTHTHCSLSAEHWGHTHTHTLADTRGRGRDEGGQRGREGDGDRIEKDGLGRDGLGSDAMGWLPGWIVGAMALLPG